MLNHRGRKLLIVNPGAGSVDDDVRAKLRSRFSDYEVVDFPPDPGFIESLGERALVVACGGDGTIAAVARALAGTHHAFGVLAMGTFNNFARGLGLPTDFDEAVEVVKSGEPRPCTIGLVKGTGGEERFLEAASIGFFGDALSLGESAKDLHYGDTMEKLRGLAASRPFRYRVTGDLELEGEALSIIVANTPSIGALVPVGATDPEEPYLELIIDPHTSRLRDLVDMAGAAIQRKPTDTTETHRVGRIRIETDPPMPVRADVAELGETPVEVETVAGGLSVILPSPARQRETAPA